MARASNVLAEVAVEPSGDLILPQPLREAANCGSATRFVVSLTKQGLLLRPAREETIEFRSLEDRRRENLSADQDYLAGRFRRYDSDEEFLAELDRRIEASEAMDH